MHRCWWICLYSAAFWYCCFLGGTKAIVTCCGNIYIYMCVCINSCIASWIQKYKSCRTGKARGWQRMWVMLAHVLHKKLRSCRCGLFSAPCIYLVVAWGCWQIRLRDLGEWLSWPHPHKCDVHFGDRGINTGFYASLPVSLPPEGKPWGTAHSSRNTGFNYTLVKTLLFLYPRTMAEINVYCRLPATFGKNSLLNHQC